jgi:hypothetical protein
MRTVFLALATSATVFATGVTEVAAGDYRYCIQGDDFPVVRAIAASPVMSQSSFPERRPDRSDSSASSLTEAGPSFRLLEGPVGRLVAG